MDAEQQKALEEINQQAELIGAFMNRLAQRAPGTVDGRWFALARTDLQMGFDALRRSVVQPKGF